MIWLVLTIAVVSWCALCVGLHRRAIGDHPTCGRCGYDLFGATGALRCSECGADLRLKHAVVLGHRLRRWNVTVPAALVLLFSLGWIGIWAHRVMKKTNTEPYKPTFWVIHDAKGAEPSVRGDALTELIQRLDRRHLNDLQTASLIDYTLKLQTSTATWNDGWGDFLEHARTGGKVSDAQWGQYWRQAFPLQLSVRGNGTPRYPLYLSANTTSPPFRYSGRAIDVIWQGKSLTVDSVPLETFRLGTGGLGVYTPAICESSVGASPILLAPRRAADRRGGVASVAADLDVFIDNERDSPPRLKFHYTTRLTTSLTLPPNVGPAGDDSDFGPMKGLEPLDLLAPSR